MARQVEHYTGTRITVHSAQSFETILSRLYSSIGKPEKAFEWLKIVKDMTSYSEESRDEFIKTIEQTVGPHGFMIFLDINHGVWMPLFKVGDGRQSKRIILGNPLIAITMLKHDLTAGLAVPIELLVLEKKKEEGGGVDLVYQLPSALIAGLNRDPDLVKAAELLDDKISKLVDFVSA